MYIFSRQQLAKLLGQDEEVSASRQISYQDHGPGYLNRHRLFLDGKTACWQQVEVTLPCNTPKKIIFCNAWLNEKIPSQSEFVLLSALVGHYEVYLWPGANKLLADYKPLISSDEFWEKRNLTYPATQRDVEKALAQQGIATEDYIIIDHAAYCLLLRRYKASMDTDALPLDDPLDLTTINLRDENVLQQLKASVDTSQIGTVQLSIPDQQSLDVLALHFPNIREVEYHVKEGENADYNHLKFNPSVQKVVVKHWGRANPSQIRDTEDAAGFSPLKSLKIEDRQLARTQNCINSPQFPALEILEITKNEKPGSTLKEVDLSQCRSLKILKVVGYLDDLSFKFPSNGTLKTLDVIAIGNESNFTSSLLPQLPALRVLRLFDRNGALSKLTAQDLLYHQQLEHLELMGFPELEAINLREFSSLRTLIVKDCAAEIALPSTLKHFALQHLGGSAKLDLKKVNLAQATALEVLEASVSEDFFNANLPCFNSLKFFKLIAKKIGKIDLSQFTALEVLDIINIRRGEYVDLKLPVNGSLKHLTLSGYSLIDFSAPALSTLESLYLYGDFTSLDKLACKKTLRHLTLSSNSELAELDISEFTALESLTIKGCGKLSNLKLPANSSLKFLNIHDCEQLGVPDLSSHAALEVLHLHSCLLPQLDLRGLSRLKRVDICSSNKNVIINLSEQPQLRELTVRGADINLALDNCTRLRKVIVEGIGVTLDLANCARLWSLEVKYNKLKSEENSTFAIRGLGSCKQLYYVDFKICSESSRPFSGFKEIKEIKGFYTQPPSGCPDVLSLSHLFNEADPVSFSTFIREDLTDPSTLRHRNEVSPVSRLSSISPEIELDGNTQEPTGIYEAEGDMVVEFKAKEFIASNYYRINVLTQVIWDNNRLKFLSTTPKQLQPVTNKFIYEPEIISKWLEDVQERKELACGHCEVSLVENKLRSLPALQANSQLLGIYCEPSNAVKVFWDKNTQQHYISSEKTQAVKIYYLLQQNANYNEELRRVLVQQEPSELLPPELINHLKNKFDSKQSPVGFLFASSMSREEKMSRLVDYCRSFSNEALQVRPGNSLDMLCAIITEKKGVCRHRSRAFMILMRLIGVPVNVVNNEKHEYCEIPFRAKEGISWHKVDLGGASLVDLTPEKKRQNALESFKEKNTSTDQSPADVERNTQTTIQSSVTSNQLKKNVEAGIGMKEPDKPNKSLEVMPATLIAAEGVQTAACKQPTEGDYYDQFKRFAADKELHSLTPLVTSNHLLAPLIELAPNQTSQAVNRCIVQQLEAENFDIYGKYYYIDNADDFARYLKPFKLAGGQRIAVDGPLKELIEKGDGIVVINWTNFTDTQLASYKSLLDSNPTLCGHKVAKELKIIGITNPSVTGCSAFLSRSSRYQLHEDFFKQVNVVETSQQTQGLDPITIDLFGCSTWEEILLGKINLVGNNIILEEGPLIQAIRLNRPLLIYNPPKDDAAFASLLQRVRDEHKLLYNGELLKVSKDFVIETSFCDHALALSNVSVSNERAMPPDGSQNAIFVGIHNWHEYFELLTVDNETKQAHSQPGLLEQYQPGQDYFYITDKILQGDWQMLLAYIANNYPQKKFHFVLAPDAAIENLSQKREPMSSQIIKPNEVLANILPVIISNDPDYLSSQLATNYKDATVVDITPQTSFNDLIINIQLRVVDDKVEFCYQEQGVLKALKEGNTVILNGELSPTLYQQLLPLLTDPSHVYCNGKRVELSGRLIAVMPKSADNLLPPISSARCDYSFKDYQESFAEEDRYLLTQIKRFYELVQKLPHCGAGRPTAAILSHKRLKGMVETLKRGVKFHKSNPIKSLFHYDYPKNSEDYAYLNVIAKYCFDSEQQTGRNESKLRHLIELYKTDKVSTLENQAWQIINCLSIDEIKAFLGEDLNQIIDSQQGIKLTKAALETLRRNMDNIVACNKGVDGPTAKVSNQVDKQTQQLHSLLEDEAWPLIVLKGPPGVGKTYTVRELQKDSQFCLYEGQDAILNWLEDTTGQTKVLLLDEANMAKPGKWDFLKGLSRNRTIYYQGKKYLLSAKHKIVATGNAESYPQRHYHRLFQEYSYTLLFQEPAHAFLRKNILQPILVGQNELYAYADKLIFAYHLIQQYNPLAAFSMRDLENLARRFVCLNSHVVGIQQACWQACAGEFAGMIEDADQRQRFVDELAEQFNVNPASNSRASEPLIKLTPEFSTTKEKGYLVRALEQDLQLRAQVIANQQDDPASNIHYKQGVLIEGDSGLGKSTLFKALLEKHGFSQDAQESQKKYYEVSVGNQDAFAILTQAFHEGAVVILDELNLDPALENLLNQLLVGVDSKGNKPEKPGFMIFSSQNPSYFKGRKSLSPALRNRLHFLYMENFTQQELVALARGNHVPAPEAFVNAYLKARKENPNAVNMRTFYTLLADNRNNLQVQPQDIQQTLNPTEISKPVEPDLPPPLPEESQQRISLKEVGCLAANYFVLKNSKFFTRRSKETLLLLDQLYGKDITDEQRYLHLQSYMQNPANQHRDFYKLVCGLAQQQQNSGSGAMKKSRVITFFAKKAKSDNNLQYLVAKLASLFPATDSMSSNTLKR